MNRMLLTNPRFLRTFGGVANDVEQMMDRFFRESGEGGDSVFSPNLDISELEDRYEVTVDLPGVKPDDVRVEMHEDRLTIAGSREHVKEEKGRQFHRIERSSGAFSRTVVMPASVDAEKIEANYQEGVLHVRLPKAAAHQPRRIRVNGGVAATSPNGDAATS